MVFSVLLFSSSCDLEVQRYKMKWTKKGEFLELDKYLIRLVLRFFAAISGKEHRLKCITKAKEISEGNERGFKERKIEREERRGTEKEMLENGFFANLGAIKILSHRYSSFVLGDFQTQIKYYLLCPHNGWLLNLLLKRQYGFRAWIRPWLFFLIEV